MLGGVVSRLMVGRRFGQYNKLGGDVAVAGSVFEGKISIAGYALHRQARTLPAQSWEMNEMTAPAAGAGGVGALKLTGKPMRMAIVSSRDGRDSR